MLDLVTTTQFKKDLKRIRKRVMICRNWRIFFRNFVLKSLYRKRIVTMI